MFKAFAFLASFLDGDKFSIKKDSKPYFEELWQSYKDASGSLAITVVFLMVSTTAVILSWYRAQTPPKIDFFVYNTNTQVSSSLSPKMSTARAQQWVLEAIIDLHSFNFTNADQVLENNKWLLRDDTFNNLSKNLNEEKSGLISIAKEKKLDITIIPTSTVRVINVGEYEKRRLWEMQMHGLIVFSGATKETNPSQKVLLTVIVEEVPTTENPYGLIISKIYTRKI